MQAACGFADDLAQSRFDIHVNVFQLSPECEKTVLNFFRYFPQACVDGFGVGVSNDALLGEHASMRAGATDVLGGHALIDINRRIDRFHYGIRTAGETATPHSVGAVIGAARWNEDSQGRTSKHGK